MYEKTTLHQPLTAMTLRVPEVIVREHPKDAEKPHTISEAEVTRRQRPWGHGSTTHILEPWTNENIRVGEMAQWEKCLLGKH